MHRGTRVRLAYATLWIVACAIPSLVLSFACHKAADQVPSVKPRDGEGVWLLTLAMTISWLLMTQWFFRDLYRFSIHEFKLDDRVAPVALVVGNPLLTLVPLFSVQETYCLGANVQSVLVAAPVYVALLAVISIFVFAYGVESYHLLNAKPATNPRRTGILMFLSVAPYVALWGKLLGFFG